MMVPSGAGGQYPTMFYVCFTPESGHRSKKFRFTLSRDTEQDHTDNRYDPRKVGPATITGVSPGRTPHAH